MSRPSSTSPSKPVIHQRLVPGAGSSALGSAPGGPPVKAGSASTSSYHPPSTVPPVATYRHLLSAGSLNPSNPLRVVAHCDVDAAYAAFEAKRLGIDPYKIPIAVQQWQGLIAISYAARAFGISRHETVQEAKRKCPELVLQHVATYAQGAATAEYNEDPRPETHKVSLDPYRRESRKILDIFKRTCPTGAVEKASIDESYFDLSLEVRRMILDEHPYLSSPPADSPLGMDTPLPLPAPPIDWSGKGHLMPLTEAPQDATSSQEHRSQQTEDEGTTWTDVALACGATLMAKLRARVLEELGYTTSAGIASNKTLAKLCSSHRKPNDQTTMLPRAVPIFLRDLPFQKIRFLGGKLGDAIASEWESSTVGDLWHVSLDEMRSRFGDESRWVWNVLRGIDHNPVIERVANKTMLASKNVQPRIRTNAQALHWLDILSTELALRLDEARDERKNLWPRTIVLRYIRTGDGGHSRQAAFPYARDVKAAARRAGEKLWREALGDALDEQERLASSGQPRKGAPIVEVVTIGLSFTGLEEGEAGQKSIQGFFAAGEGDAAPFSAPKRSFGSSESPASSDAKRARIEDQGRAKRKPKGIQAMFLKSAEGRPKVLGDVERLDTSSERAAEQGQETAAAAAASSADYVDWTCPKCQERISVDIMLPDEADEARPDEERPSEAPEQCQDRDFFADEDEDDDEARRSAVGSGADETRAAARDAAVSEAQLHLSRQVASHEDWHFAVELERKERDAIRASTSSSSATTAAGGASRGAGGANSKAAAKEKKGSSSGIGKFFARAKTSSRDGGGKAT